MDIKLQELTDKIYNEGVEKGKSEASQIIEKAQKEADAILAKAKADANKLLADTQTKADNLDKNTKSELKLFAEQSVNALKSEITDLLCGTIVTDSVKAATADKTFMQKTITDVVKQWMQKGDVSIDAKDAQALTTYFEGNAKELLNKGVKITEVKNLKTDFSIAPAQGGYKIAFGDKEFIEYFKDFLRPKLIEMLF